MTVNEILKALELCPLNNSRCSDCMECPYGTKPFCTDDLQEDLIDLITRQKAENEVLTNNLEAMALTMHNSAKATRAEAIKLFAKRLKKRLTGWDTDATDEEIKYTIDNLVQEMAGDENG